MSTGPGAARAAAPGLVGGRAPELLVDVGFEVAADGTGGAIEASGLIAVDRAGGSADLRTAAPPEQRNVLLAPRAAPPAAGGSALFLDGWSTWVDVRRVGVERIVEGTVEAWFAPRAFSRGDADGFTPIVDATGDAAPTGEPTASGGLALGHDRAGRIAARIAGRLIVGALSLRPGRWHRLELVVEAGRGELRLDGSRAAAWDVAAPGLDLPDRIVLGRARNGDLVEGLFPVAAAVGLLGPARVVSGRATRPAPAGTDFGPADVAPDRARYAADPYRPIAHFSAPQGWMNEPHGAVQVGGVHHVFFQHNPAGPYWGHIAWGHATSRDLVHWEDAGIAVAPGTSPVAPDGVWSGSSVIDGNGDHLLYVTAGDFGRTPDQAIAVARPTAGGGWSTDATPVLDMPGTVPGHDEALVPGQFRDPFVWREGRDWFMLVGAGLERRGGAALLFHSEDGSTWAQQEPLHVGDVGRFPATGVMWELPVLLPIGAGADGSPRHALFVAPWWAGASEHHLQHVWHWVGVWDAAARRFTPDHREPREFDGGGHLTGPSGTVLDDGRAVLWTIAQDTRSLAEFAASGWAHNAGLPLELGLHDDGMLRVRPVAEVDRMRGPRLDVGPDLRGRHLDLQIAVAGPGFEIEVLRSDDGAERTVIGVTGADVWIDRSLSSLDEAHRESRRRVIRRPVAEDVHARLVIDGSMIELYVDERVALTSRAYPVRPDSVGVRLRVPPGARLIDFSAHLLHAAYAPKGTDPAC